MLTIQMFSEINVKVCFDQKFTCNISLEESVFNEIMFKNAGTQRFFTLNKFLPLKKNISADYFEIYELL